MPGPQKHVIIAYSALFWGVGPLFYLNPIPYLAFNVQVNSKPALNKSGAIHGWLIVAFLGRGFSHVGLRLRIRFRVFVSGFR